MRLENIPKRLYRLVQLVNEWGINDDGFREEKIENANDEQLKELVNQVDEMAILHLNEWLSDEHEIRKSTSEYINYTCFLMAFEYALSVLKSRNNIT